MYILKQNLLPYYYILLLFLSLSCKKEENNMNCQNNIEIELLNITNAPCGEASGKIEIIPTIGVEYSIDNQNFEISGSFENLTPGIYNVIAKDADGCEETKEFQVISGVSLAMEIMPIVEATCALAGCHVNGGQTPDLTQKANIISQAQRIRTRISDDEMPPENTTGPELSAADLETFLCWIDDGANDN